MNICRWNFGKIPSGMSAHNSVMIISVFFFFSQNNNLIKLANEKVYFIGTLSENYRVEIITSSLLEIAWNTLFLYFKKEFLLKKKVFLLFFYFPLFLLFLELIIEQNKKIEKTCLCDVYWRSMRFVQSTKWLY
jgi:hypothetical protein